MNFMMTLNCFPKLYSKGNENKDATDLIYVFVGSKMKNPAKNYTITVYHALYSYDSIV